MNMVDVLKYTRSQVYTYTLTPSGWAGSAAPFTYNISCPAVTDFNNVEVIPSESINADQVKILLKAMIVSATQSNGSIVLRAFGNKPTINLPVKVIVRGGLV